ncbi:tetraspanin-8-like [Cyprinodon tularosa]|uniref:tetraspanin-8-like n=1 Tax=Cyprinodon tularosa TaxID=77115 RepID=UPI0018E20778|nr:tetraspanin-8-like [Cyprinodon tularosa]
MGKINSCLKAIFVSFNILFALCGALLIYGLVATNMDVEMRAMETPGTLLVWVFAIAMLGISLLGSIAAHTEKKACLKVFAGFMAIGMIIMLIFGITTASSTKQLKENLKSDEVAKIFMEDRQTLKEMEKSMQCCGWTGFKEYSDIPYSCSCISSSNTECTSNPQRYRGPSNIYSQSCRDVIIYYADIGIKMLLGVYFGFSVVAMFGLIISLNMVGQINRHDRFGDTTIAMRAF